MTWINFGISSDGVTSIASSLNSMVAITSNNKNNKSFSIEEVYGILNDFGSSMGYNLVVGENPLECIENLFQIGTTAQDTSSLSGLELSPPLGGDSRYDNSIALSSSGLTDLMNLESEEMQNRK